MSSPSISQYQSLAGIALDRESPVPLYFQLALQIEEEIRSGVLSSGDRLENEVKIAADLGLSRPTVRSAFSYLVEKGLVERRRGQGTTVINEKVIRNVELTSLFDDLELAGKKPTTKVLHNEVIRPTDLVKGVLGLNDDQLVIYLERVRYGDNEPIALLHNYIPTNLVTFNNEMLEQHSLYELLKAAGVYPHHAIQRISATISNSEEARIFDEPEGKPLLTLERTTFDGHGKTIVFEQHVYRSSLYTLISTVSGEVGAL